MEGMKERTMGGREERKKDKKKEERRRKVQTHLKEQIYASCSVTDARYSITQPP